MIVYRIPSVARTALSPASLLVMQHILPHRAAVNGYWAAGGSSRFAARIRPATWAGIATASLIARLVP